MEFPAVIPVFPLPNVVLFPGVPLPLHIFEPRYREMVRDASAGHEIIGMVLLRGDDWQVRYLENPDVYEVGCAGKLVNVDALPDGKFNIVLHGLREFVVRQHLFDKSYRQAEVSWRNAGQAPLDVLCRDRLVRVLTDFLRPESTSPAGRLLRSGSLSDELLVNFFSYALDISPVEKQGLLEAPTLEARGHRLADVIEFHVAESRLGLKAVGSPRCH